MSQKLSPLEKFGYGLGDFGSNLVFQGTMIFMFSFYTSVVGLTAAVVGMIGLGVRLMDTVTDPVMGAIADRTKTRWGSYRPYLLWGALPYAIFFVMTFTTPEMSMMGRIVYATISYGGLFLIYTFVNIPYCALGGVISADSQDRVSANSYRFAMASTAGIFVTAMGNPMIEYFGKGDPKAGYPWAMAVFAVLAVASFVACFCLTKERVVAAKPQKANIKLDIKHLFRNDQWIIVCFLVFFFLVSVLLRMATAETYAKLVLDHDAVKALFGDINVIAVFLTTAAVSQVIGATFTGRATKLMDKRPSLILSQAIMAVGCLVMYFTANTNVVVIFGAWIIINFFHQLAITVIFSMMSDTIDYGELKTGRRLAGLVSSGMLFALKFGVSIGIAVQGFYLGFCGYDGQAETQTPEALIGILATVTLLPAVIHLIMIPIGYFYKLSHKRCAEIRKELDLQASQS